MGNEVMTSRGLGWVQGAWVVLASGFLKPSLRFLIAVLVGVCSTTGTICLCHLGLNVRSKRPVCSTASLLK